MCDLFEMPPFENFTCGLLVVDQLSNKIFTRAQKTKTAAETFASFMDIFKKNKLLHLLQWVSSDAGGEFNLVIEYCEARGINYVVKSGQNKAFVSENYIKILKYSLYRWLRTNRRYIFF